MNDAVAALRAGELVILPTDTVYGLCAFAYRSEPAERLYQLKQRDRLQPTALVANDLDLLLEFYKTDAHRVDILAARGPVGDEAGAVVNRVDGHRPCRNSDNG